MATRFGVFVFLLALAWCGFAQESTDSDKTFTIQDYKPVRFRVQSLTIDPGFYCSGNSDADSNYSSLQSEYNQNFGAANVNVHHSLRNHNETSDVEVMNQASIYGGLSGSSNENSSNVLSSLYSKSTSNSFSYSFSNYCRYRRYIRDGFFLEGVFSPEISQTPYHKSVQDDASISSSFDSTHYQFSKTSSDYKTIRLSSAVNTSVGKGWIADVTGASVASYIIDRIAVMTGNRPVLTNAQMRDFALLIDKLRRRRILDGSLGAIETIDTLCQYLRREKIIEKESGRLGMEVDYAWSYGLNQMRLSGQEIKCTPFATISYSADRNTASTYRLDSMGSGQSAVSAKYFDPEESLSEINNVYGANTFFNYGASVYAGFSRPYTRFFEVDGSIEFTGTMVTFYDTATSIMYEGKYPNAKSTLQILCSWYPSLRSTVSFGNTVIVSKDFSFRLKNYRVADLPADNGDKAAGFTSVDLNSSIACTYFLSRRCSYNINAIARFNAGNNRSTYLQPYGYFYYGVKRRINYYVTSNLSYAIF